MDPPKKPANLKTGPEKKYFASASAAPVKKTLSTEIPASGTNATKAPAPMVVESESLDDEDVEVMPQAPEEDAEAELGTYSNLFSNRKVAELI